MGETVKEKTIPRGGGYQGNVDEGGPGRRGEGPPPATAPWGLQSVFVKERGVAVRAMRQPSASATGREAVRDSYASGCAGAGRSPLADLFA